MIDMKIQENDLAELFKCVPNLKSEKNYLYLDRLLTLCQLEDCQNECQGDFILERETIQEIEVCKECKSKLEKDL